MSEGADRSTHVTVTRVTRATDDGCTTVVEFTSDLFGEYFSLARKELLSHANMLHSDPSVLEQVPLAHSLCLYSRTALYPDCTCVLIRSVRCMYRRLMMVP